MEERRELHRKKFNIALRQQRGSSRYLFTPEKLRDYIDRVRQAQSTAGTKKEPKDYALLQKYDVRLVGSEYTLVKKSDAYCRYVDSEHLFDTIDQAHVRMCHRGEKNTHVELKKSIANVTKSQIRLYLDYCTVCEENRQRREKAKKRIERPILSTQFGERGQMDLIDMRRHSSGGEYQYIFHYQDHFTKFSILKPLRSKRAEEVAARLFEIFVAFGAPKILQSDNGNEFVGAPVKEMMRGYWPATQLVHGAPRYPQSQGSVERANGVVENMLRCLARDSEVDDWSENLEKIQWAKNTCHHRVIQMAPYKAVFGQDPPVSMMNNNVSDISKI